MKCSALALQVANDNIPTVDVVSALLECMDLAGRATLSVRRNGAPDHVAAAEVRRQFERQMGIAV